MGEVAFNKGPARYFLNSITNHDMFFLLRMTEGIEEVLRIREGDAHFHPHGTIEYKKSKGVDFGKYDIEVSGDGASVKAARELLAKAQKDFGKV